MLESKKSAVALELHARRIKFYWTNLDDLAMKVLEVDLRPFGDTIKDGPQGGTTFSDLISVISRSPMRVGSFYQLQVGQHAQSRREDIGRDVFWRRKQLRIRERSMHQKIANYQKGPLITEHVQCRTDRTHGPPINPVHIIGHILAPGCHLLNEKFSNIALNRTLLSTADVLLAAVLRLLCLASHEVCNDFPDIDEHRKLSNCKYCSTQIRYTNNVDHSMQHARTK